MGSFSVTVLKSQFYNIPEMTVLVGDSKIFESRYCFDIEIHFRSVNVIKMSFDFHIHQINIFSSLSKIKSRGMYVLIRSCETNRLTIK